MKILPLNIVLLIALSTIGCPETKNDVHPKKPLQAGGFVVTGFRSSSSDSRPGKEETGITEATKRLEKTPPEETENRPSQLPGTVWVGGDNIDWLDALSRFPDEKAKSKSGYAVGLSFKGNSMVIQLACQFSDATQLGSPDTVTVPVTFDGTRVYLQEEVSIRTKSKDGKNACEVTLTGDYLDFELVQFSDGNKYASVSGKAFKQT